MIIYKFLSRRALREDLSKHGYIEIDGPVSFTSEPTERHAEFGSYIIGVNRESVCRDFECVDVIYEVSWMEEHPDILLRVTGQTMEEWMDWAKENYDMLYGTREPTYSELASLIQDEIYNLYAWEEEVVVEGHPIRIHQSDIIYLEKVVNFKRQHMSRGRKRPGWFGDPYRHALASKGVRTR